MMMILMLVMLAMVLMNQVKAVALAIYQRIHPVHHYLMLIEQFVDDDCDEYDGHLMLMVMIGSVNLL